MNDYSENIIRLAELQRTTIELAGGRLPQIVTEAEQALLADNNPFEVYQRGGSLVRPVLCEHAAADESKTRTWRLVTVREPWLRDVLTRCAVFQKKDARAKKLTTKDCPKDVAETLLAREGEWCAPILRGVITTPFLRRDGSLCVTPGYDAVSGLLFKPSDQMFSSIPARPTKADALESLKLLDKLLDSFPFVTKADRSIALSGILTALDRRSMETAPLHAFNAPVAGSGKSLLVNVASIISTGYEAPVISPGRDEAELEKRLGATLMAGQAIASIDNIEHPLESMMLCMALTQTRLSLRVLGFSRIVETPVNTTFFATGNNLTLVGDLVRRVLLCTIDPQCERPEEREFEGDLTADIKARRGNMVAAALTILRAWHATGEKIEGLAPFGSFEEWSRRIRKPLIWLGCADPVETVAKVRDADPKLAELKAVTVLWRQHLNGGRYSTQEIIDAAVNAPAFFDALKAVAATKNGSSVDNVRLGRWLGKNKGRVVGQAKIADAGIICGCQMWQLVAL